MPESKQSWEEIKALYPDEWVILVDVDVNETTDVTAGIVFDHNPDKRYIHERQKGLRGEVAVLYTGTIESPLLGLGRFRVVNKE
jgi:hypothetical protein